MENNRLHESYYITSQEGDMTYNYSYNENGSWLTYKQNLGGPPLGSQYYYKEFKFVSSQIKSGIELFDHTFYEDYGYSKCMNILRNSEVKVGNINEKKFEMASGWAGPGVDWIWTVPIGLGTSAIRAEMAMFLSRPFYAAAGRYSTTEMVTSWYQFGNTAADLTVQFASGKNMGSLNYGSAFGNLYFSNPFVSTGFGTLYSAAGSYASGNLQNDYIGLIKGYMFGVAGNILTGGGNFGRLQFSGIQGANWINPGMKLGLGGYAVPLMWNIGTGL